MALLPIRILLAVPSPFLTDVLRSFIAIDEELELVGSALGGTRALAEVVRTAPDVAVLDFCLKDCEGLRAAELIRLRRPATEVVMLCDYECQEYERAAREAGASACVVKAQAFSSLVQAIKRVARNHGATNQNGQAPCHLLRAPIVQPTC